MEETRNSSHSKLFHYTSDHGHVFSYRFHFLYAIALSFFLSLFLSFRKAVSAGMHDKDRESVKRVRLAESSALSRIVIYYIKRGHNYQKGSQFR
jgi:hypothetical protein